MKNKSKVLNNSSKIDLNLRTDPCIFQNLEEEFFLFLNKKRIHKKKYQDALNCILSNLSYNYRIDKTRFINTGLNKTFFLTEDNPAKIRYDIFMKILNFLIKEEYIIVHKGFNHKNNNYSKQTRFISTKKLQELFINSKNKNLFKSSKKQILLKDKKKELISFNETILINKRKELLNSYNEVLKNTIISYKGKILPQPFLYRIFNKSSFKLGGRFYGGFFQQFSKENRKNFFINGNPVVELDFNCLHINLLYNKINKSFQEDAYDLPTFPSTKYRKSVKLISLIMINAISRKKALQSIRHAIKLKKIKDLNPAIVMEELLVKHKPIKKFFFKGLGLQLQYQESIICERVIKTLINRKKPIPVLSIHDSFICESKYKKILLRSMKSSFKSITNNPSIKIKEI